MAITGNTELLATKRDLILEVVQRELKFNAKFLPTIEDVSRFAVPGAKTISFPKLDSFVAADRASGAAGGETVLTATSDLLELDKRPYVSWIIDTNDKVQSAIDSELEFAKRAASAHSRRVDSDIVTELEAAAFVGTASVGDITRDIILEFRRKLRQNEANMDAVTLAISADQEEAMLKIAAFTEAQIYGTSNIPAGVIGHVYGIPVMISNNLGADQYFMYDKGAAAIGFQRQPQMDEQKAIDYGSGAVKKVVDQMYGLAPLQAGELGVAATESPLAVKDANL